MESANSIRWSRILLVLLLLFAILEGGTRLGVFLWIGRPYRSFSPYMFLPDGGYWNNPDYTHPYFIHNSVGLRNTEEFSIEKPPNTIRILAIGHSALYSGVSDTPFGWPTRPHTDRLITSCLRKIMEKDPDFTGKRIEVMNAGLNLASLKEMTSNFMNNLSQYHPDVLIIFGSANHFLRVGEKRFPRPFVSESNRIMGERFELAANDNSLYGLAERFFRTTTHYSAFFAASHRVVDKILQKINAKITITASQKNNSNSTVSQENLPLAECGNKYPVEKLDEVYTKYVAFLDAIFAFCEHYDIKPVLFWEYYLLNLYGVKPHSDYEKALSEYYIAQKASGGWNNTTQYFLIRDRIKEHLREKNIPVIDLFDDFQTCQETVFNDYLHYSESGNKWVAQRIYVRIKPLLLSWQNDSEYNAPRK